MSGIFSFYESLLKNKLDTLPGGESDSIKNARLLALTKAESLGLPHGKQEEWKYTKAAFLKAQTYTLAAKPDFNTVPHTSCDYTNPKEYQLCFSSGYYHKEHSILPKAISLVPMALATLPIENNFANPSCFTLLNDALWQEGFVISMNDSLDKPLRICFRDLKADEGQWIKLFFILAPHVKVKLILDYGENKTTLGLSNILMYTRIAPYAELHILEQQNHQGLQFVQHHIHQAEHSKISLCALSLQARWLRHEVNVYLEGMGARSDISGVFFGENANHLDHHIAIHHSAPNCQSQQFFKGVLSDKAKAVFNGKSIVAKGAQKTITSQKNNTMLLSPHTEINAKPELEIYANDVLCSHGATVGELSEEALFYLLSRGIDETTAKKMLLGAFVKEVIEAHPHFNKIALGLIDEKLYLKDN